jgi:hypothetical protein
MVINSNFKFLNLLLFKNSIINFLKYILYSLNNLSYILFISFKLYFGGLLPVSYMIK